MTITPTTTSTSTPESVGVAHLGTLATSSPQRSPATLSAHTLLWCWIVVQTWSQSAVRAAVARSTVPVEERESGEALSSAAIAVGMVIIAGLIVAALKTKSTTIVSNVCTNADPSSC